MVGLIITYIAYILILFYERPRFCIGGSCVTIVVKAAGLIRQLF